MRILILGAGLTGLFAARALAAAGHELTIIEREAHLGGLAASIRIGGFAFDLGAHRFWANDPKTEREILELMNGYLVSAPAKGQVLVDGRRFTYPPEIWNFVRQMPPSLSARCLFDLLAAALARKSTPSMPESFEEWAVQHYGRSLYDLFVRPYTAKSWGRPAAALAAPIASERIPLPQLGSIVDQQAPAKQNANNKPHANNRFYYPATGIGAIAERLAAELQTNRSVQVVLPAAPVRFMLEQRRIVGCTYEHLGADHNVSCDAVISTIPLETLASLLPLDTKTSAADLSLLRYRAAVFVMYMLKRPQNTTHGWLYVPSPDVHVCRIYEPQNWGAACCPPGKGAMCAEIHCDTGDAIWTAADDKLQEQVTSDLQRIGILRSSDIDGYIIHRSSRAYPMEVLEECASAAGRVIDASRAYANLITCGRLGGYRYINMDKAVQSGHKAAELLIAARLSG